MSNLYYKLIEISISTFLRWLLAFLRKKREIQAWQRSFCQKFWKVRLIFIKVQNFSALIFAWGLEKFLSCGTSGSRSKNTTIAFGTVEALFGGGVTTSTTNPIQTEMMLWWNLIRVYQTEKIAKKKRVLTALFQGRTQSTIFGWSGCMMALR